MLRDNGMVDHLYDASWTPWRAAALAFFKRLTQCMAGDENKARDDIRRRVADYA